MVNFYFAVADCAMSIAIDIGAAAIIIAMVNGSIALARCSRSSANRNKC